MTPFQKFTAIAEASAEPVWLTVPMWVLGIVWCLAGWAIFS